MVPSIFFIVHTLESDGPSKSKLMLLIALFKQHIVTCQIEATLTVVPDCCTSNVNGLSTSECG